MIESFLRSLPNQNRLTWLLVILLIAFPISGVGLALAVSRGVRSNDWTETKGVVAGRAFDSESTKGVRWRHVKVDYTFDGRQFSRFVSVFATEKGVMPGNSTRIYVNPDRPTELASAPGLLAIDYGLPLARTLALLAAIVVVVCIVYSPKDDYESEVNETLM